MQEIKNIIFDLGGVLLDIDFEQSQKAFRRLGIKGFGEMVSPFHGNHLFQQLEMGMETPLFYQQFRALTGSELSNEKIEQAWCALLLGFRTVSVERLNVIKSKYKIYLLSNTNEIHLQHIHQMFRRQFKGQELDDCFDAAYYSHRIQLRKPDTKAWQYVIEQHNLQVGETLFIDDGTANIEAARSLGLQTIQLLPGMLVEELEL
jgi:glucose-1-phosphatase